MGEMSTEEKSANSRAAGNSKNLNSSSQISAIPPDSYKFENFFHPFIDALIEKLNDKSLAEMLDPSYLEGLAGPDKFDEYYKALCVLGKPLWEVDVGATGSYASYNWEL